MNPPDFIINYDDVQRLESFLKEGNIIPQKYYNMGSTCVIYKKKRVLNYLLENSEAKGLQHISYENLLNKACQMGNIEVVTTFFKNKIKVKNFNRSFFMAISTYQIEIIKFYIDNNLVEKMDYVMFGELIRDCYKFQEGLVIMTLLLKAFKDGKIILEDKPIDP